MTTVSIELTEEEFDARFPLLPNHLNPNASWAYGENPGCLFETYGEELDFVRRQDPQSIWTLVDGEDHPVVLGGFHLVNRIGYLVSATPVPPGSTIFVPLPTDNDEPFNPFHE